MKNPGCIGILTDIGDICHFAVSTIDIELSDEHPMPSRGISLQKPSQHT